MRKAAETNGESLVRGLGNFLADVQAGTVRMTNPDDFQIGRNLATTPGKVVFRNRLIEVIHYAPSQPKVHAVPVVIAWLTPLSGKRGKAPVLASAEYPALDDAPGRYGSER